MRAEDLNQLKDVRDLEQEPAQALHNITSSNMDGE